MSSRRWNELRRQSDGRGSASLRRRKERPHPGAQLRITDVDGLRVTAFATNSTRGQLPDLELRHRSRARAEDRIRCAKDWPDFAALFRVCHCAQAGCPSCEAWQLTPWMACALWFAAGLTADDGYDGVTEHGDTAVTEEDDWALFDSYPHSTYRQDATWRRHAARAFDDLATGRWPLPRCPAEEMALHTILLRLGDRSTDDPGLAVAAGALAGLPTHPDDLDWAGALDALVADHDILLLFDPASDGIEDPLTAENRGARIGDYRPTAWSTSFTPDLARDPARGFRR